MEEMPLKDKRIADLVEENYVYAYVLFYFGIKFFEYSTNTLEQVCTQKGLRLEQLTKELGHPTHIRETELPLTSYPLDLIIEYLKHAHLIFIKHKLPYIANLVENFQAKHSDYAAIERDLKILFPLFVEDFIQHVYQEEDTLFNYIQLLEHASKGNYNTTRLFYVLEKNSLQKFANEHEVHDDEMKGIRKITKEYVVDNNTPLHIKVIYNELKDFEKKLIVHARIENEILFPKAMTLENRVKLAYFEKAQWN
jgi:regulator of cell morphogenesis and NO signaling